MRKKTLTTGDYFVRLTIFDKSDYVKKAGRQKNLPE